MADDNRKHRGTGNPRGGKRTGAGRKKGTFNALPLGAVQAIQAMGYRVPEGAQEHLRQVADRAWERIQDVMEGRVDFKAMQPVLKAACVLREEVCGSLTQKHEHSFSGMTDAQLQARFDAITGKPTEAQVVTEAEQGETEE